MKILSRKVLALPEENRAHARTLIKALEALGVLEDEPERPVYNFEVAPPDVEKRLDVWLTLGKDMHPLTVNLVVRFARALAGKLADAEKKYGYSDGWRQSDWMDECRAKLADHVRKGDPRDVAAYCAFLWHHGERTALLWEQAPTPGVPASDSQSKSKGQT